jgi:hypothetical protein
MRNRDVRTLAPSSRELANPCAKWNPASSSSSTGPASTAFSLGLQETAAYDVQAVSLPPVYRSERGPSTVSFP